MPALACLEKVSCGRELDSLGTATSMKRKDERFRAPKGDARYTRFFDAAIAGSIPQMEAVFTSKMDVNALQPNRERGQSALHIVAASGNCLTLRWLLDRGAEVNLRDSINETAISKAAYGAHTKAVKLLLDAGATIDLETTTRHETALHSVLQDKKEATMEAVATIELLLKRGFNPDKGHDDRDYTLFDHAARVGNFRLVKLLRKMNVRPHDSLSQAYHNYDMVRYLLDQGAPIYSSWEMYSTITTVADEGDIRTLRLLLSYASEQDIKEGITALHSAAEEGHFQMVDLLLDSVHATAVPGSTPELISILLAAGASTSTRAFSKAGNGETPLHCFARAVSRVTSQDLPVSVIARVLATFFLVLSHTDDVNVQDNAGHTPLHRLADYHFGITPRAIEGKLQAARLLINRGADTTLRSSDGLTAGDYLCKWGQHVIMQNKKQHNNTPLTPRKTETLHRKASHSH
ncbi:MAG: hypothetical protein Q9168_005553 [Polycauliona sp. 1 TL-2023]